MLALSSYQIFAFFSEAAAGNPNGLLKLYVSLRYGSTLMGHFIVMVQHDPQSTVVKTPFENNTEKPGLPCLLLGHTMD